MCTLTIVTICRENGKELRRTLKSVERHFDARSMEQLVVDGSVSDDCREVAEKFSWVQRIAEKNGQGVYGAMNEGAVEAVGRYVIFLNAGDELFEEAPFQRILQELRDARGPAVFFGDTVRVVGGDWFRVKTTLTGGGRREVTPVRTVHSATFYPRELFDNVVYDAKLSVSADYDLTRRAIGTYGAVYLDALISIFEIGGISSAPTTWNEVWRHYNEFVATRNVGGEEKLTFILKKLSLVLIGRVISVSTIYRLGYRMRPWRFERLKRSPMSSR